MRGAAAPGTPCLSRKDALYRVAAKATDLEQLTHKYVICIVTIRYTIRAPWSD